MHQHNGEMNVQDKQDADLRVAVELGRYCRAHKSVIIPKAWAEIMDQHGIKYTNYVVQNLPAASNHPKEHGREKA